MHILFLTKRYYSAHDLINDHYGRLYEIPLYLAKQGHQVDLVCHSYRKGSPVSSEKITNLDLSSRDLGLYPPYGFWTHYQWLKDAVGKSRPDIIVAASDCYQVIIGAAVARHYSLPFIADLYDNFLAFKASHIPGIPTLFARALKSADAVTAVSRNLCQLLGRSLDPSKVYLLENAVSSPFLSGYDRQSIRHRYNFANGNLYIGTAGDLRPGKGIDKLITAFMGLVQDNPHLHLVLAGPRDNSLYIPASPNIHYLGQLPHGDIPAFLSALDLGVVCIRDDDFGRYCFPQKFCEMVACGIPVVVSAVGEMLHQLAEYPDMMFNADDAEDMQRAIGHQLQYRVTLPLKVPGWQQQAEKFGQILQTIRY